MAHLTQLFLHKWALGGFSPSTSLQLDQQVLWKKPFTKLFCGLFKQKPTTKVRQKIGAAGKGIAGTMVNDFKVLFLLVNMYRVTTLKWDTLQNWLLLENPQFFCNQNRTLAKLSSHELIILNKFHDVWRKVVDFSLVATFSECPISEMSTCKLKKSKWQLK